MVGKVMTYEAYQEWVSNMVTTRRKNIIGLIEIENAIAADFGTHRQTIRNHKRWLKRFGFIRHTSTGLFELIPDPRQDLERRLQEAAALAEQEAKNILAAKPKEKDKNGNGNAN